MSTFEIVITVFIFAVLLFLFIYIFWNFKRRNPNQEQQKTKLDELEENVQPISPSQKLDEVLDKIGDLVEKAQTSETSSKTLSTKVETLNSIFISNYQRGKLGETTLNFILESMLGNNSDVVKKQYQMRNGNRPDVFLSDGKTNIPIDSKFPFDNFNKLLKLQPKSLEYEQALKSLKTNIKKHLLDVSDKYISIPDHAQQAVMYIPSQPLFELIYSDNSFSDLIKLSNDKHVWISGPNTLPVLLKAIDVFVTDAKRSNSIREILLLLKKTSKEFERFEERWSDFDKGVDKFVKNAKNISTTAKKIRTNFNEITNPKLVDKVNNLPQEQSDKK